MNSDVFTPYNEYLDLIQANYIRIPDELYFMIFGNNITPTWIKKIISKFIKGIPDLIIFKKGTDITNICLWMEAKSKKGKLSQGQKNKAKGLNLIVFRSFEDFKNIVDKFLKGEQNQI